MRRAENVWSPMLADAEIFGVNFERADSVAASFAVADVGSDVEGVPVLAPPTDAVVSAKVDKLPVLLTETDCSRVSVAMFDAERLSVTVESIEPVAMSAFVAVAAS